MISLLTAVIRARVVRPLLWWTLAVLAYVVLPVPPSWALLLVVGLGVALTATVTRLRHGGRQVHRHTTRGWELIERLGTAIEDRIRGHHSPRTPGQAYRYSLHTPATYGHLGGNVGPAYDPGALLGAIAAVLAAEGLPAQAGPALPACAQLLTGQGIRPQSGALAPTAHALVGMLAPGHRRRQRAMALVLLAGVIRAILTHDHALPQLITTGTAENLFTGAALILHALGIHPDDQRGTFQRWPVIPRIIDAAAHRPPCQPPHSHRQGGRS